MAKHDRVVHATITTPGYPVVEVVRYDRAGKWYWESASHRKRLTLAEAAALAADPKAQWHAGRYGGTMFDAQVRRLRSQG